MKTMVFLESFLQWIQLAFSRYPFNGGNRFAIRLYSEYGTGLDGFSIEQYGTSPATGGITSDMGTRQVKDLADHMHQQQSGFHFHDLGDTVYSYRYNFIHTSCFYFSNKFFYYLPITIISL
jgi:hypothetical protein